MSTAFSNPKWGGVTRLEDLGLLCEYCGEPLEVHAPGSNQCRAKPKSPVAEVTAHQAVKHDDGKPRYDLVPPEALDALSRVLTFGAAKYSSRNWEKGMDWGRVFGAMMRHAWAWWRGEHKDPETGYSHLWHVLCCAAFLVTYEQRRIGKDDRHVTGQEEKGSAAPTERPV